INSAALAQSANGVACNIVGTSPIAAGSTATLVASGGNGSYVWSSPGVIITNPNITTFAVNFAAAGTYPVTVTSAGASATCNVVVVSGPLVENPEPGVPAAPGLPNTGELPL